jgi:hypothetical protein
MVDDQLYYACEFLLDKRSHFVIWYSADTDGLLTTEAGNLLSFSALEQLQTHAGRRGINLEQEDIARYDFDDLEAWCAAASAEDIRCMQFLDAWNMFHDVALTTDEQSSFEEMDRKLDHIYNKLFRGSNLPALATESGPYVAQWSDEERHSLAALIQVGAATVRKAIS